MKPRSRNQEKELADQTRALRNWKQWHAEQLDEALAGAHGATIAALMLRLNQLELNSSAALLAYMENADWNAVDYATRLTVLHQINAAISRMRVRHGLPPIDDPLPNKRNAFLVIKDCLFPNSPAKAGSSPSEVATAERTGRNDKAASE